MTADPWSSPDLTSSVHLRRARAWLTSRLYRLCERLVARPYPVRLVGQGNQPPAPARMPVVEAAPVRAPEPEAPAAPGLGSDTPSVLVRESGSPDDSAEASHGEEPRFPVDVVYTWVDDRDPAWRARYTEALRACEGEVLNAEAANAARFRNRDELRYSLRSLALHATFVRNVYIVTAGQVPGWLNLDAPNLRVVPHEEILDSDCLPTFNSHAIETALHRIDGLSEHYLYLNDDFFFGRDCRPSTFFTPDGRTRVFPNPRATVAAAPASPADRPVDSASKNTRELVEAELGLRVDHKMQHAPYPQRRSVLAEMEERFPWVFKQTARNPFRHHTDVNIPSCFSHYYALATGAAVTDEIPASYINVGSPWAPLQMRRLLQRADRNVFCLNEGALSLKRRAIVDATVEAFLQAYFPVPSPFERAQ